MFVAQSDNGNDAEIDGDRHRRHQGKNYIRIPSHRFYGSTSSQSYPSATPKSNGKVLY